MANHHFRPSISSASDFLTLATANARRALALMTTLVFAVSCVAQDVISSSAQNQLPSPQSSVQIPATPNPATETIPAGTRLALVLTNPIFSNTTHRGDSIHTQTTAPITVGDRE